LERSETEKEIREDRGGGNVAGGLAFKEVSLRDKEKRRVEGNIVFATGEQQVIRPTLKKSQLIGKTERVTQSSRAGAWTEGTGICEQIIHQSEHVGIGRGPTIRQGH